MIVKYNKIKPNERRPPGSQPTKNLSEEDKTLLTLKNLGIFSDAPSPKSLKKTNEDQLRVMIAQEKEYSWIVKTEKVPSGESLLKLFGKILFETASELVTNIYFLMKTKLKKIVKHF